MTAVWICENLSDEEVYQLAVKTIREEGKASTSLAQRKLQIGYNRAARIMERMEEDGIITKSNSAGFREIL